MAEPAAISLDQIEPEKAFIIRFKSLPVLWDPKNPEYTNKYRRMKALEKLLPYLKKSKPNATTYDVRKKINCLRSNYRRELRKITMSQTADSDEVYCPKNWSFRYLTFLGTLEEPGQSYQLQNDMSEEESLEIIIPEVEAEIIEENSYSSVSISPPPQKFKKRKYIGPHQIYKYEYSDNTGMVTGTQEINPMVLEWVNTLDKLDPMQRLYAKKAINDILFEAELGNLHRYSVKINETNEEIIQSSPSHSSTFQ